MCFSIRSTPVTVPEIHKTSDEIKVTNCTIVNNVVLPYRCPVHWSVTPYLNISYFTRNLLQYQDESLCLIRPHGRSVRFNVLVSLSPTSKFPILEPPTFSHHSCHDRNLGYLDPNLGLNGKHDRNTVPRTINWRVSVQKLRHFTPNSKDRDSQLLSSFILLRTFCAFSHRSCTNDTNTTTYLFI